ncbi:hypothetical protein [Lentilactobacillus sunkii]|uniref:Uncharacterized protein n=1 Tax=Lentilactobacillus sunkii DSM 19904 TaxID=1423808 RepID=A0A0R1L6K8_9LACO|nr:hypothetical protein [Lentilactobacillus sunkii]KRK88804.1 hypothetical protein FD17_GL002274 [Lentilactobacillus sunkii DSM 19904]
MRLTSKIMFSTLVLFGTAFIQTQPAHATVIKNSFLKTQRTITTYNSKKQVKVTIPKGTTVQVAGIKHAKGNKYVDLNVERLSYNIRKPLLSQKQSGIYTHWLRAKGYNFKQIHKPVYLSYFAVQSDGNKSRNKVRTESGNLWRGDRLPADYTTASGTRLRVTSNGYLEYYAKSPFAFKVSPKPTASLKVTKANHPIVSGQTILTFKSKISGLPFVKKSHHTYRLTIESTGNGTVTVVPNTNNVKKIMTNWIYRIGKVDWYENNSVTTFK